MNATFSNSSMSLQYMMKTILYCVIIATALGCGGNSGNQSSDNEVSKSPQKVEIPVFTALEIALPGSINIGFSEIQTVHFSGVPNASEKVKIEVKNNKAYVRQVDPNENLDNLSVIISTPGLEGIYSLGSANMFVDQGVLIREDPILINRGSGNVLIKNIKQKKLTILQNGSGTVTATGYVEEFIVHSKGSGNIDAVELGAENVEVINKGSGNVIVTPIKALDGTVSGSGDIIYSEEPTVTKRITGSGKVKKLEY